MTRVLTSIVLCLSIFGITTSCKNGFDRDTDVYIVNLAGEAATVTIQGRDPVTLGHDTFEVIKLVSGTYNAEIAIGSDFKRKLNFTVSRGKGNPFDDNTIGVFNVQGMAPIILDEHFFAVGEEGGEEDPWVNHIYNTKVFYGQDYFEVGNVDYPFTRVPEEINITDLVGGESRYQLRMPRGDRFDHLDEVFGYAPDSSKSLLGYTEYMIEHGMNDVEYVSRYIDNSRYYEEKVRGEGFLSKLGYKFEGWIMYQEVIDGTRYLTQIADPPYGFVPGADSIVLDVNEKVSVFVDYPVSSPASFPIEPDTDLGYSKWGIINQIKKIYMRVYLEEGYLQGDTTMTFVDLSENRPTSYGTYGIHTYYYQQLFLSGIQVVRSPNNEVVLRLWVEGLKEEKEKGA